MIDVFLLLTNSWQKNRNGNGLFSPTDPYNPFIYPRILKENITEKHITEKEF